MKTLFVLTAAALTTALLSLPATAATVGCDQGAPTSESVNATECGLSSQKAVRSSHAKATKSKAYASKKQASKAKKPAMRSRQSPSTSDAPRI